MLPTPPLALPSPTALLPHHTQLNELLPLPTAYLAFPIGTPHLMTQCLYIRPESKPTPRNERAPSQWASPTSA